jgi:hypothetical protein
MVKVLLLYGEEPDATRYAQHVELCEQVSGATFRHGRIFGAPTGDPEHRYYAEFEFPDMDAFRAAARSREFAATGKDAAAMGYPLTVEFAELA